MAADLDKGERQLIDASFAPISFQQFQGSKLKSLDSMRHHGTNRVAFLFAPIVTAWLLCISSIGIYNIFRWNRHVFCAISPIYMLKFLKNTGTEGWVSLGGVVLSITGVETMFADLGHFSSSSIKVAFTCVVYPCLILAYMGEAAFLSKHHEDIQRSFYKAIPGLAVTTVMFVTTCLMALVMIIVWKKKIIIAVAFLLFFGSIEVLYISASVYKFVETEEESASKLTSESFGEFENTVFKGFVASEHPYTNSRHKEKMVQSSCDIQAEMAKTGSERLENTQLKHESLQILKAKESGVAYILGHSHAKAKKSSSIIKKIAINVVYTFLSKNSREPDVILNVPHTSLLEVGMIYYV
ncbi:hypothetical protein H0E87_017603 [Populus deltoides]|uniref:Uncharacterized protein n=1 Tax=Populus deltoides TaxID=3696 RepID=A0A8T2Y0T9_POPDE|nr:hypothetical protein H0E87_017603 [Populus deltoides]